MTEIEKPLRRVAAGAIWHFVDGVKVHGPHDRIWGDVSGIWGHVTDIRGDLTDIWGDVTDIRGDVSGVEGDVSLIPASARPCKIANWVRD